VNGGIAFEGGTQRSEPVNAVGVNTVEVAVVVKAFDVLCHDSFDEFGRLPPPPESTAQIQLSCVELFALVLAAMTPATPRLSFQILEHF
jgi:hypothetical protein